MSHHDYEYDYEKEYQHYCNWVDKCATNVSTLSEFIKTGLPEVIKECLNEGIYTWDRRLKDAEHHKTFYKDQLDQGIRYGRGY